MRAEIVVLSDDVKVVVVENRRGADRAKGTGCVRVSIPKIKELLKTTPDYLLGAGEYDTDILDILGVLKKMSLWLRKVALEQIKVLSSVC